MSLLSFIQKKEPAPAHNFPPLQFHNTLSGQLEPFIPLLPKKVSMYNCGPTVYDRQTIGNMRPYVFADTLKRTLEYWGYSVLQVINITDVGHLVSDADEGEDKMEQSAKKQKCSARKIADEYTNLFFTDLDQLGIDRSRITFPRATEYIGEQIALVQTLLEKGYAYQIKDGIYFDTSRFPAYGKLGGIELLGLRAGARVKQNAEKRDPHDFALWKFSGRKSREQEWESPWGKGFPGWHIECTAMIFKLLGRQIDIHTGGVDHIPIHHNNEIAQAEALTGKQYVRYWLHNEFITIESKKISKSIGNTIYVSQLEGRGISPLALRYWFLNGHYRSPMNFTWEAVEGANAALLRLNRHFFEDLADAARGAVPDENFLGDFTEALVDDLNTPQALARVWDLIKNPEISAAAKRSSLLEADRVLGLGLSAERPMSKLNVVKHDDIPAELRILLNERESAREAKDFTRADELRARIAEAGYDIEDGPNGPALSTKN